MDKNKDDTFPEVSLTVPSHPRYLSLIRAVINEISTASGFSDNDTFMIKLATDEACANIIRHSYGMVHDKPIFIKIFSDHKFIEIHIKDKGKPLDRKKINQTRPARIKPGGLGLYFIHNIMDKVTYDADPEGNNIVKMQKKTGLKRRKR